MLGPYSATWTSVGVNSSRISIFRQKFLSKKTERCETNLISRIFQRFTKRKLYEILLSTVSPNGRESKIYFDNISRNRKQTKTRTQLEPNSCLPYYH
jgi:hypothetical protein